MMALGAKTELADWNLIMPTYTPISRTLPPKDTQTYVVTKNGKDRAYSFALLDHFWLNLRVVQEHANVLQRRKGEIYVHYFNTDKRLDEWVPEQTVQLLQEQPEASSSNTNVANGRKRKRKQQHSSHVGSSSPVRQTSVETAVEEPELPPAEDVQMTEEEFDIQQQKRISAQRNYDKVNFGIWQIKTWYTYNFASEFSYAQTHMWYRYYSPYPLSDADIDDPDSAATTTAPRISGIGRGHGNTFS